MLGGMIALLRLRRRGRDRPEKPRYDVTATLASEDEQAMCASKCEDTFIRHKNDNMAITKIVVGQVACRHKCGCPENSKH